MPPEILSILQQVRFRVETDAGTYEDALYYAADVVLDLPSVLLEAAARGESWRQRVLNPPPTREPTLEELEERETFLAAEQAVIQTLKEDVPVVDGDRTPPTVPKGLAGESVKGEVQLKWGASTDAVGVAGYRVYRDSELLAEVRAQTYIDVTAKRGTSYRYSVSAIDRARNESAHSSQIGIET